MEGEGPTLNVNRVTIYRAKYLAIVTLKVLPTTCFRFNLDEAQNSWFQKWNQAESIWLLQCKFYIIKCLDGFEKMTGF